MELDVAETADGAFAVYHDWMLDCRTEGTGDLRARTLADLLRLDIGHGEGRFAADALLLNFKTADAAEGVALARWLTARGARHWALHGDAAPVRAVQAAMTGLRGFDRQTLWDCLLR